MTDLPDSLFALPEPVRSRVASAWEGFVEKASDRLTTCPVEIIQTLPSVWGASRFIAEQCLRQPEGLFELTGTGRMQRANAEGEYAALLQQALTTTDEESALMSVLRRFRNREMVRIAWRDISGWAPLNETLADLSHLAEACIQAALDWLFVQACEARGTPVNQQGQPQSLVVLGMGKLGAWELNFSSDIDLIFAYRDDGELSDRRQTSYTEFYIRLARNLVRVLDANTADGFVFRVDTRLRPFGDSGPLVMSFDAMEAYYQSQAREWERYAMVKARTVAGDREAGAALEQFLRPFVYRRYLDYRALGELRELKRKITTELIRKDRQDNVKLGPGGIREIEFIGQAFQLIRGGQEKRLRERRIQTVLAQIAELGLMPVESVQTLLDAYHYLRTVENRLQQYADQQTHDLPKRSEEQTVLASAMGHTDWENFKSDLDAVRGRVHAIFQQVIAGGATEDELRPSLNGDAGQTRAALETLGFPEIPAVLPLLESFQQSHPIRNLTPRGEAELKRLLPELVRLAARAGAPLQTLERILELLQAIASRNVYLTLLAEKPAAREQLASLAAASPWITHTIARHPVLLDDLLDPRTLYQPLTRTELHRDLQRKLASIDEDDPEQLMVALRQFKQTNVLRVAAADISGAIPLMVVSDYLTYIAETLVDCVMQQSWRMIVQRHGAPPGTDPDQVGGFGVIAYGKLGGLELGYGSDLDLVFLYEGEATAATRGSKPVTVAEFYTRLAKRMIHLLTTNTLAGTLYETDLRLRPSGNSGLLVTSVEAYQTYQMQVAWTWEQQALVKARCVAGDQHIAQKFSAIRETSLRRMRDRDSLRDEVREMREKMRESLSSKQPGQFNIKHDAGGIVDIEFMVQFGVLSCAHESRDLTVWTDVVRLLESLTAARFIGADDAAFLKQTYCLFRDQAHRAALQETPACVPDTEWTDQRDRVKSLWQQLMNKSDSAGAA